MIMKTVSREGMLLAGAVGLLTLFRVSMGNKMKIVIISATLVLVAAVIFTACQAIGRYMTLFSSM